MARIEEILRKDFQLPSPPAVAVRLLEAIRKETTSAREFASIIGFDPALSAKILKIANSSFYALSEKVNTIERALAVLGLNTVKNVALSFALAGGMRGSQPGAIDYDYFWKRSVTAAVTADLVSPLFGHRREDTFLTAMLQDIGIPVLYSCMGGEYLRIMEESRLAGEPIEVTERKRLGFDHQEVGSQVLKLWGLPVNIYEPIRSHHRGEEPAEEYRITCRVLSLSNLFSSLYHGGRTADRLHEIREALGGRIGAGDGELAALVDSVAAKTIEVLEFFDVPSGDMKPLSQIVQEANEELVRLNMSYEMVVLEYKQAKEKAEHLARELQAANERLREISIRDGLTGLYNRRHFEDVLVREMDRANRYMHPLSLVMADVDFFKSVNDRYGHPAGDMVIATIGEIIHKVMRISDMAARYGGEEFMVLLPATGTEGARQFAERIRRTVEGFEFFVEGAAIRVTVSLGVASYDPRHGRCDQAAIVLAADKALYASKDAGRNRVSHLNVPAGHAS